MINSIECNLQSLSNAQCGGSSCIDCVRSTAWGGGGSLSASRPDEFVQSGNQKEKKLSTAKKFGIAAGILVIGGIIAAAVLGKGKKINISPEQSAKLKELVSLGKLDEKYLEIFKSTEHLSGDKFIKEVYNKISKMMGYENCAPKLHIIHGYSASGSNTGVISVSTKAFDTKAKQFSTIRHELEHFRQHEMIYRAFGKDAYIEAKTAPAIEKLRLNEDYCKSEIGKTFKELSEQELTVYKNGVAKSIEEKIKTLEKILKSKGKINQGTPEYAEAQIYLEATKNYKTPTMVLGKDATPEYVNELKNTNPEKFKLAQQLLREYDNNILEKTAYTQGTIIKDMYELFLSVIKP